MCLEYVETVPRELLYFSKKYASGSPQALSFEIPCHMIELFLGKFYQDNQDYHIKYFVGT